MKNIQQKYDTVIRKNTFYFFDREFEEKYEGYVNSIKETLLVLKNQVENRGLKEELLEELILKRQNGLKALLVLTGFSNESLKRLITFIRIMDDPELNELVFKKHWANDRNSETPQDLSEWPDHKILRNIQENAYFRKGLINIFFKGSSVPILSDVLPLFELKKLSISKLKFDIEALIDTLIRYKEKGSYSAKKKNNPEILIENILEKEEIGYETGDLKELIEKAPDEKRTMDFIIPDKKEPRMIIECLYCPPLVTGCS